MGSICIVTDNTAQFSRPTFPGQDLIRIIPFDISLNQQWYDGGHDAKISLLGPSAGESLQPHLKSPEVEKISEFFLSLGAHYDEIVAITSSSHLCDFYSVVQQAAHQVSGRIQVQIIDSLTTSVGLGMLVQNAASLASNNKSAAEVEALIRSQIPHVYSVFCIPSLSYLYYSGFLDRAQSQVGEYLGLFPIFTMEDGQLTPMEKVRNSRLAFDYFQEFLDEFDNLFHIALLQSIPPLTQEAKLLREFVSINFSHTPFSEHPINLPLATILGPRAFGLFTMENIKGYRTSL
jgi:DegV family protein with EDD domain